MKSGNRNSIGMFTKTDIFGLLIKARFILNSNIMGQMFMFKEKNIKRNAENPGLVSLRD